MEDASLSFVSKRFLVKHRLLRRSSLRVAVHFFLLYLPKFSHVFYGDLSQASVAALDFVACQSKKAANIYNRRLRSLRSLHLRFHAKKIKRPRSGRT